MGIIRLATHSGQLERWLGKEGIDQVSAQMKNWYGPPIPVAGVPGKVYAYGGGDFRGTIATGKVASAWCAAESMGRRLRRGIRHAARNSMSQANTGFASFADLVSEATAGKSRTYTFQKTGPTGVANVTSTLWQSTGQPAAGAAGSAAPGGRATDSTVTGGFPFTNPTGGDTQHFVTGYALGTVAGNSLLLYDRIFDVAKTMNSTATEAVTGVPTRYQSTTGTAADYAGGNFLFVEVQTVLPATAHNWTVCTYTNQAGSSATLPSLTGNSSAIVQRLDHPTNQFFAPLATGDIGVQTLTQMQCSAAVATGAINFVIGHPIAWMPTPIANMVCVMDGVFTAFNLTRVFDSACLSFLEVVKPSATATTYTGTFQTVAG